MSSRTPLMVIEGTQQVGSISGAKLVQRHRDSLREIADKGSGLYFAPNSATLPDIHHPEPAQRLFAEWLLIEGEACLRRDRIKIPLSLRIGQGPKIIAVTGPSGIGKTTLVNALRAEFGHKQCRTFRRKTTRGPRMGETHSPYFDFITDSQADRFLVQDQTVSPRELALGCRFASEWYLLFYGTIDYVLRNSRFIIFPCHLDTAVILKRRMLYGMHICYITSPEMLTNGEDVHPSRLQDRSGRHLDDTLWRRQHALMMTGVAKMALQGGAPQTVDSVLVVDRHEEDMEAQWPTMITKAATSELLQLLLGMSNTPGIRYPLLPEVEQAFARWRALQSGVIDFIRSRHLQIRHQRDANEITWPDTNELSLFDGRLPLAEYQLFGPGERYKPISPPGR